MKTYPRSGRATIFAALAVAPFFPRPASSAALAIDTKLETVRKWTVYDARARGPVDLASLCEAARLPCGAVLAKGETLGAPAGPLEGMTVGALLDRMLAAHPGYRAEMREGVLGIRPVKTTGCEKALARASRKAHFAPGPASVAALRYLRGAGFPEAGRQLASLTGDNEDARFARVELIVHDGGTARRVLDALARADGQMLWVAETSADGKSCASFRLRDWRSPQGLEYSSTLVSVAEER